MSRFAPKQLNIARNEIGTANCEDMNKVDDESSFRDENKMKCSRSGCFFLVWGKSLLMNRQKLSK